MTMDYQTAWFYFFSAVPQTLAGAIGLLAAFVLFRLERLSNRLDTTAEQFFGIIEAEMDKDIADQGRDILRHNGWDSFMSWLSVNVAPHFKKEGGLWSKLVEFGRPLQIAADVHKQVIWRLRISIPLICGVILGCLCLLPVGAIVPKDGSVLVTGTFALGLFFVALCVWSIVDLTLHVLTKSDTAIRDSNRMAEDWELDA
jgi:hypothetical protein